MTQDTAALLAELAQLENLLGQLFDRIDHSVQASGDSHQQIHHKVDEWIHTNRAMTQIVRDLLQGVTANSEALGALTMSYENTASSWHDSVQQLHNFEPSIRDLSSALGRQSQLQAESMQQLNGQMAQLQPLLQQVMAQVQRTVREPEAAASSTVSREPDTLKHPVSARRNLQQALNLSVEWIRQATVPLAILGSLLLMAGSGVGYAYAQVRQPLYVVGNTSPLTLEEAELLAWARSGDGHFARDLLDWNSGALDSLHCTQDVERLGVTLEVQGRPADYGFCTLWVVPPQKRRFLEAS